MLEGRRWGNYIDLPQQKPQQFNYIGAAYEAFFARASVVSSCTWLLDPSSDQAPK